MAPFASLKHCGWFVVKEKHCSGLKNKLRSMDYKWSEQGLCDGCFGRSLSSQYTCYLNECRALEFIYSSLIPFIWGGKHELNTAHWINCFCLRSIWTGLFACWVSRQGFRRPFILIFEFCMQKSTKTAKHWQSWVLKAWSARHEEHAPMEIWFLQQANSLDWRWQMHIYYCRTHLLSAKEWHSACMVPRRTPMATACSAFSLAYFSRPLGERIGEESSRQCDCRR